jgi:hypothetical protein
MHALTLSINEGKCKVDRPGLEHPFRVGSGHVCGKSERLLGKGGESVYADEANGGEVVTAIPSPSRTQHNMSVNMILCESCGSYAKSWQKNSVDPLLNP